MDIGKNLISERVVKHWKKLHTKVVAFVEIFNRLADVGLKDTV